MGEGTVIELDLNVFFIIFSFTCTKKRVEWRAFRSVPQCFMKFRSVSISVTSTPPRVAPPKRFSLRVAEWFWPLTEVLRLQASARPQSPLAALFGVSPLTPDARQWYRGALGELRLATALRDLPAPWTLLFPAFSLVITLAAFQFLGDGLRDWMDVRGERAESAAA